MMLCSTAFYSFVWALAAKGHSKMGFYVALAIGNLRNQHVSSGANEDHASHFSLTKRDNERDGFNCKYRKTSNFFLGNGYLGIRFRSRDEIAPRGASWTRGVGESSAVGRPSFGRRRCPVNARRMHRVCLACTIRHCDCGVVFFGAPRNTSTEAPVVAAASAEP